MRIASRANVRIEQQQAVTTLNRLEAELRKTSVAGVTLAPGRLAINPLVWTNKYFIYAWEQGRLLRMEHELPGNAAKAKRLPGLATLPLSDRLSRPARGVSQRRHHRSALELKRESAAQRRADEQLTASLMTRIKRLGWLIALPALLCTGALAALLKKARPRCASAG